MKKKQKIICQKCKHYFVTWDKTAPHGCRTMGFKTLQQPSMIVFKNSGEQCMMYELKHKEEKKGV